MLYPINFHAVTYGAESPSGTVLQNVNWTQRADDDSIKDVL